MSTAERTAAGWPAQQPRPAGGAGPWVRFLRSELRLIFGRWRNLALLAVLAGIPVLIGVALKLSGPGGGGGGGPAFLDQVAGNGVFLAFASLTVLLTLVLPLTMAVVSGDSMAGEASHGTLRYLLAVPAGRTRLLAVKYAAVVIFGLAACATVAAAALIVGVILFPVGPVTLLSGSTVSLGAGLLRLLLAVTAVFPLIIGIALRLAAPRPEGGDGGTGLAFFNQLAGNGVFLTFIALSTLLVLVLPVVVAVVAGDSVAGEAGYGTLRYLLAVPAGRTRLLAVKYGVIVTFALCATFIVSAVALAAGAALFPVGPVTLLSGTTVSLAAGLLRLLFVTLYVTAAMAALGAIGLAISTLTEHAIGAIATLMILVVTSEVIDNVPQLHAAGPYLPTHWWLSFDSLLRVPVDTSTLLRGLLSFAVYAVLFGSFAWARFTSADVTS